eukprot:184907-Chlamydomonas_euryale.AAC.8
MAWHCIVRASDSEEFDTKCGMGWIKAGEEVVAWLRARRRSMVTSQQEPCEAFGELRHGARHETGHKQPALNMPNN